jgi:D-alanyl-D-alanine carboxypeptidase
MTSIRDLTRRPLARAALAGSLLLATAVPSVGAHASTSVRTSAPAVDTAAPTVPPVDGRALRAAISDLDHPPTTAAQVRVRGSAGHWYGTSGVADLRSQRSVRPRDRFRVGSITKAFVATIVLQLVRDGDVRLRGTVQHYLPGVLPDRFPPITVGQLLNHTSGLPPESGPDVPDTSTPEAVLAHRFDRWTPERLLATVTDQGLPMRFVPGSKQEYRGINYVLAALVVEEVTGHSYAREVRDRILRPLRLRDTLVPRGARIRGPHVHGYLRMTDGSPARYSTGLQTATFNGLTLWGKTGEVDGYSNGMFATRDQQRRVVWSFNPERRASSAEQMTLRIVDAATSAG